MAEIYQVTLRTDALKQWAARAPEVVRKVLLDELRKFFLFFLEDLREQRLSGNPVHVRTGALRRDGIASSSEIQPDLFEGRAIFTLPYAATQEYGDPERRPKNSQFLAIPLPAALTASGVPRYPSPLRQSLKAEFETVFARRSQHGTGALILFGKHQKTDKELIALFVLKRSVSIPARMGARALLEKQLPALSTTILVRLAQELGPASGGGAPAAKP